MKFIDEYRDKYSALVLAEKIKKIATREWSIMEVCGGQTHTIMKYGLEELLPVNIRLIHGPGCPVCVTPIELIDKAVSISLQKNVIFTSYGDMLRVPGSNLSLLDAKAEGADVRVVYSPLDSVKIASDNKGKTIVFFSIGFETTAPANAAAIHYAKINDISNFLVLSANVLIPPALELILSNKKIEVNGLIAPGHVCTVTGYNEYERLASLYHVPVVVTGFEPIDLLQAIYLIVFELESSNYSVKNQYSRVVSKNGNKEAQKLIEKVFYVTDRKWRGIGIIPNSGLKINEDYSDFDAEKHFMIEPTEIKNNEICIAGDILCGIRKPTDCSSFSKLCTPSNPLGAPMVSSEGACSAYYKYRSIK